MALGALLVMGALLSVRESDTISLADERAQALANYDLDHNGRLSDREREAMRRDRASMPADREGYGFRRFFSLPPEIIEQYDRNRDGGLDDDEEMTAREGIRQRWNTVRKEYDADGSGRLEPEELDSLARAIDEGKVTGIPAFLLNQGRRGLRGDAPEQGRNLRQFDVDGDGRLSETELQAARAFLGLGAPPLDLSR